MAIELDLSERFLKSFGDLAEPKRAAATEALKKFMANPRARGLNFEKVKGSEGHCTIRCNKGDRILLKRTGGEKYVAVDVGTHDFIYRPFS